MAELPPYRSRPPGDLDDMPVEELIRLSRELTRRITNQDRQRLAVSLRESGHLRMLPIHAPTLLQQFFAGEIDLDADLARRFGNPPLLSTLKLVPEPGAPLQRQASAVLSSNDESAVLTVDARLDLSAGLEFSFTLFSALGLRFRLGTLVEAERRRWVDLMRRPNGIAFLWTRERWEAPYVIFVVREQYGRIYAFAPQGLEAAARLTPDAIAGMVNWLEDLWFPGARQAREAVSGAQEGRGSDVPQGDWAEVPSHMRRPEGPDRQLQQPRVHADQPEQQWETPPHAAPDSAEDLADSLAADEEW